MKVRLYPVNNPSSPINFEVDEARPMPGVNEPCYTTFSGPYDPRPTRVLYYNPTAMLAIELSASEPVEPDADNQSRAEQLPSAGVTA